MSKHVVIIVCQENMRLGARIFIKITKKTCQDEQIKSKHMRSQLIHRAHANTHNSQLKTCNDLSLKRSMQERYDV